jgi:hypothetical protein
MIWLWIVLLLLGIGGLAVGYMALSAYQEVVNAPREAMEYCGIHGPLREKHLLVFLDRKVCFRCWHKALQAVESNGKGH